MTQQHTHMMSQAGDSLNYNNSNMAARTDGGSVRLQLPAVIGQFHQRRSGRVVLSEGRQVGSCHFLIMNSTRPQFAFSNDPIPIGLQFSVKVMQEGLRVSLLIQTPCTCSL